MRLLKRLSSKTYDVNLSRPTACSDTGNTAFYRLVLEYFYDIREAKAVGYSWSQIKLALQDELRGRHLYIPDWEDLPLDEYFSLAAKNQRGRG